MENAGTNILVPLWGVLATAFGVVSSIVGVVAWVFMNFATKAEQQEVKAKVETMDQHLLQLVRDVSYIRGRLEPDGRRDS